MQKEQYYAHIKQNGEKQTVMEHLLGTADRAGLCLKRVGLEKSAYLAGLLHDMGKFTKEFQAYLKEGDLNKRKRSLKQRLASPRKMCNNTHD